MSYCFCKLIIMYTTDLGDIEVLNKVVEENIEASKKSGMPLI